MDGLTQSSLWRRQLADDGFALLAGIFAARQVAAIRDGLQAALSRDADGATLRAGGEIYGARNVLQVWPPAGNVWRTPPLPDGLRDVLGPRFGLVRVLYFDKPPEQSWALPWHRDLTIAVRDNRLPSERFAKPTRKAGVPHVEAPVELLEQMLTLRLHLDDVTDENGPLQVIPGSHRGSDERSPCSVLARAGDVLLMRPLLSHASIRSVPGTTRHRRILHLEFAGLPELPDGYAWYDFRPGNA